MDSLEVWRINEILTVKQAVLLILGKDPQTHDDVEKIDIRDRPKDYEAYKQAIVDDIKAGKLYTAERVKCEAEYFEVFGYFFDEETEKQYIPNVVDIDKIKIKVDRLKTWLLERNLRPLFFFPEDHKAPNFLDPDSDFFSPKLAAAVLAWHALVNDESLYKGKSLKGGLIDWLTANAKKLQLTESDGKPITTAIKQIATVANWKPEGGAPKTPMKK